MTCLWVWRTPALSSTYATVNSQKGHDGLSICCAWSEFGHVWSLSFLVNLEEAVRRMEAAPEAPEDNGICAFPSQLNPL